MASFLTTINDALENAIANSAEFQSWTGTANATAAKAFIFNFSEADLDSLPTKFCNIHEIDEYSFSRDSDNSDAGAAAMVEEVMLQVYFIEQVATWSEVNSRAFLDPMGTILTDVLTNAATYFLRTASIRMKRYEGKFQLRAKNDKNTRAYQHAWVYSHKI